VVIASVSLTLGVVYYLLNSRRARKREKINMVMRLYMSYNTKEFHAADFLVLSAEFKDYDEFKKKFEPPTGQKPIHLAIRQISSAYELLGFLLHSRLIDLRYGSSHFSSGTPLRKSPTNCRGSPKG
jgi:hypothetical protein